MQVVEGQVERSVRERYAAGAGTAEAALCCPVEYDAKYLDVIPDDVLERDYGCGDPSRHLRPGETVLDLGSGTGKICFIAAQVVGAEGRVIGIDMTAEMLDVSRVAAPVVAERLGYTNVEFRRGRIQDLALDLDRLDAALAKTPASDADGLAAANATAERLRRTEPLVASGSVDVVVSNCVLNLVDPTRKTQMFREIYRVLADPGRAVISDIVSDEPVPAHLQEDADLWSGCISGAFTETGFLDAFEEAGFHGVQIVERQNDAWQTVEGIEFRSVTIEAFKGKDGPCWERNQAVIYRGPFKEVVDDDGHRMKRGARYAVCDKTYRLYQRPPYEGQFELVDPRISIPLEDAAPFDCSQTETRHPRQSKGLEYDKTTEAGEACCGPDGGPDGCC